MRAEIDKDPHADCRYWGLAWWQCSRYHSRLARFHADRANRYAEESIRLARWAVTFVGISLAAGVWLVSRSLL
jgi:hypothetical protein